MFSRTEIRSQLTATLHSLHFKRFYSKLQSQYKILGTFTDAVDLLDWLHDPTIIDTEKKDSVLLTLVSEQQKIPQDCLQTLLCLSLWPGLDHLFNRFKSFSSEPEELWGELQWAFFQVIASYPTQRRIHNVAGQILLDVKKQLYRNHINAQKEKAAQQRLAEIYLANEKDIETGSISIYDLTEAHDSYNPTPLDDEEIALGKSLFQKLTQQNIISDADAELLILTVLKEIPIRDAAQILNISYDAAKKRKQRVLRVVRNLLKDNLEP